MSDQKPQYPCWSHYHEKFRNGNSFPFAEFWKAGKFCDVDVFVGARTFRAHRIVLAAASAYFRTVFSRDGAQTIDLQADPEIFDHVLELIYCGCYNHKYEEGVLGSGCRVSIDEKRRKVLALAHFLQADAVVCEVSKWLARDVDLHPELNDTLVQILFDAYHYEKPKNLFVSALEAVAKRITELSGELLQNLPFQVMFLLLQSELIACSEDQLLDVLTPWQKQHPDAVSVKQLLSLIRFEVMAKEVRSRAEQRPIVQEHLDVLADIYRDAMDGYRRSKRTRRLN